MEKTIKLLSGDCLEVLKTIPDNSIDSIVTDPPYGLEFMGKEWDSFIEGGGVGWKPGQMADTQSLPEGNSFKEKGFGKLPVYRGMNKKQKMTFQEFCFNWARECYRVLKPGGHLLAFGGSRMYHRLASGVEDAGFEIRDQIMWVYGSGFPKSLNIGKAIDKIGIEHDYDGYGTALKPAHEPIVMARKPLSEKSIVENVLKHGTGGINIDGSRIGTDDIKTNGWGDKGFVAGEDYEGNTHQGRFPANIIFDEEAGQLLDEQSGKLNKQGKCKTDNKSGWQDEYVGGKKVKAVERKLYLDTGGASRFFYCPKTSKKDRNEGLDGFEDKKSRKWRDDKGMKYTGSGNLRNEVSKNNHPTVKPTDLMRYLVNLVTPKGGTVLDPFMGSGSTGKAAVRCGVNFIGIEKEQEYMDIAEARINHEKNKPVQGELY